ncbi:MAG: hypothetical protein KBS81_01635 [Spirochaetales bacterium]|nr:hypothetical protein [Candidatus Physcosoma equi]
MTKDVVPEGFSLSMALVDAIPVVFFGLDALLLSKPLQSPLFFTGAVLCLVAGLLKVLWKFIVVLQKKNVWPLFMQMRIVMPTGFLMMILGFVLRVPQLDMARVGKALVAFPSAIFYVLWVLGMTGMIVAAKKLDSSDPKANWIEQGINGCAQVALFLGILLGL